MEDGGGSVLARGRTDRLYSRAQGGEGGFLAYQGNQDRACPVAWPEYGAKGGVTPDFPKKTKCKPICMPGSSFMHIVT
jgi:hypothetical protein